VSQPFDQNRLAEDQDRSAGAEQPVVPRTGEPTVDAALDSLQGLESEPLADHHDRLVRVHEELHAALHAEQPDAGG